MFKKVEDFLHKIFFFPEKTYFQTTFTWKSKQKVKNRASEERQIGKTQHCAYILSSFSTASSSWVTQADF